MRAEEKVFSPMRPTSSQPFSLSIFSRRTSNKGQITPSDPPPLFRRSSSTRL